jgi:hypothetical protein
MGVNGRNMMRNSHELKPKTIQLAKTDRVGMMNSNVGILLEFAHNLFIIIRYKLNENNFLTVLENLQLTLSSYIYGKEIDLINLRQSIQTDTGLDDYSIQFLMGPFSSDEFTTKNYTEESEIIKYLQVLDEILERIISLFHNSDFEQLYMLVDLVHNFPRNLYKKQNWKPKFFWDSIQHYRKMYDDLFLLELQTKYKSKNRYKRFFGL